MLFSLGAMAVMGSATATAGVIYNNFDLGTYDTSGGWTVSGSTNGVYGLHTVAGEFVAGATGTVTGINLALVYGGGDTGADTVSLYDVVSGAPGSLLGSWSATSVAVPNITSISVSGGPTLTAGTSYFLVVDPGASNRLETWNSNTVGDQNDIQINFGSGLEDQGVDTLGAFSILGDVTAAPEPSTMVLLGSVLVGAFARRRFSR